ncbi:homologous recombination OB-fold protein isoform X2 [Petromyzon marinus]
MFSTGVEDFDLEDEEFMSMLVDVEERIAGGGRPMCNSTGGAMHPPIVQTVTPSTSNHQGPAASAIHADDVAQGVAPRDPFGDADFSDLDDEVWLNFTQELDVNGRENSGAKETAGTDETTKCPTVGSCEASDFGLSVRTITVPPEKKLRMASNLESVQIRSGQSTVSIGHNGSGKVSVQRLRGPANESSEKSVMFMASARLNPVPVADSEKIGHSGTMQGAAWTNSLQQPRPSSAQIAPSHIGLQNRTSRPHVGIASHRPLTPMTKSPLVQSSRGPAFCSPPMRTPGQMRGHLFQGHGENPCLPTTPTIRLHNPSASGQRSAATTPTWLMTNRLVQLVSASNNVTPRPSPAAPSAVPKARRFPGPAGLLPQQLSRKMDDIMISAPQTPAHGAVAKLSSLPSSQQSSFEEDFGRGPWVAMKAALGVDERNPSSFLCTHSIIMVLRKASLKQLPKGKVPIMCILLKSLVQTGSDAKAVFKDPTGEMQGTIHRQLVEQHQSQLRAGVVLHLQQVGVLSPSCRNHYLNITPRNVVRIFMSEGCTETNSSCSQTASEVAQIDQESIHKVTAGVVENQAESSAVTERGGTVMKGGSRQTDDNLSGSDNLDSFLEDLPEDAFADF